MINTVIDVYYAMRNFQFVLIFFNILNQYNFYWLTINNTEIKVMKSCINCPKWMFSIFLSQNIFVHKNQIFLGPYYLNTLSLRLLDLVWSLLFSLCSSILHMFYHHHISCSPCNNKIYNCIVVCYNVIYHTPFLLHNFLNV